MRRVLAVCAAIEIAAGAALMIAPALVVMLLFGAVQESAVAPVGRVTGIAMLALGVACLPGQSSPQGTASAFRGLLAYNLLIPAYLAYLATVGGVGGVLLWPTIGLHIAIAAALVWTRRARPAANFGGQQRGR